MEKHPVVHSLLERLAPPGGEASSERIWRFSERMATVYQEQMRQFDEDAEARQWRQLYSAGNMPPPSDTQNMADIAAMLAFYSPTNFCKFQKLVIQQLLEWESRQAQINPYPFGAPSITLVDIGAGLGIASLAAIDVLATWSDVVSGLGYKQLGVSVKVIAVEPDANKQEPRRKMLNNMARSLDAHSINIERVTDVISPYPEPDCIRQVVDAVEGGSLAMCCMSNFLSSPSAGEDRASESFSLQPGDQPVDPSYFEAGCAEFSQSAELVENAARYAEATAQLLTDIPFRNKLLLASELKERGVAMRMFASALSPALELSVHWNRVRFYSPEGSYWHSLRSGDQVKNPDWATGFWSLAYWGVGNASQPMVAADALSLGRI
ncbi:MAG: hypothetical protein Q7T82_13445 [Armatimonadota bacterium]|nr:hypothetical protein [Armatimonadota bacterium]